MSTLAALESHRSEDALVWQSEADLFKSAFLTIRIEEDATIRFAGLLHACILSDEGDFRVAREVQRALNLPLDAGATMDFREYSNLVKLRFAILTFV